MSAGTMAGCGRNSSKESSAPGPAPTLKQPALGRLLREIARGGADFFYRGPVADAIERRMRTHGSIMTKADLATYLQRGVREREPVVGTYRGMTVISMPPPSSMTLISLVPLPSISIWTWLAPASMEFSRSSLTTEAGRSITSPAAI